jgi:hypothetical protein
MNMGIYDEILSDEDEDAGIHLGQLGEAVSVWAWMQHGDGSQTVATAAITFNTTPDWIRRAINQHPWAFLTGDFNDPTKLKIEHDGE